jgi:hypothetical protein
VLAASGVFVTKPNAAARRGAADAGRHGHDRRV